MPKKLIVFTTALAVTGLNYAAPPAGTWSESYTTPSGLEAGAMNRYRDGHTWILKAIAAAVNFANSGDQSIVLHNGKRGLDAGIHRRSNLLVAHDVATGKVSWFD